MNNDNNDIQNNDEKYNDKIMIKTTIIMNSKTLSINKNNKTNLLVIHISCICIIVSTNILPPFVRNNLKNNIDKKTTTIKKKKTLLRVRFD